MTMNTKFVSSVTCTGEYSSCCSPELEGEIFPLRVDAESFAVNVALRAIFWAERVRVEV